MLIEVGNTYSDDCGRKWTVISELKNSLFLIHYNNPTNIVVENICESNGRFTFSKRFLTENPVSEKTLDSGFKKTSPPKILVTLEMDDETPKISYTVEGVAWGGLGLSNIPKEKAPFIFNALSSILEEVSEKSFKLGQESIKHNIKELLK